MSTPDAPRQASDLPSHATVPPFDASSFIEAAPSLPRSPWCAQPRVSPAQARAEQLGEAIAELSARIQAATYELLVLIREFDASAGWNTGFRSCAHWLNWRTGLDLGAAREKVRVARVLGDLPLLSDAMQRGQLSYSKVRALTRVATAENERSLLDFARCGTAAHVERLVRGWRRVDRVAEAKDTRRRHETRELRTWVDADGMVVIHGLLSPEVGAVVQRALEAASERLYKDTADTDPGASETTAGQRRADALGLLAESALAADLDRGTAGDRYQVVVHVDEGVLENDEATGQSALEDGPYGRVAPGSYPPGAPTDPDVPNSGIRLLGLRVRCATVDAVYDTRWGERIVAQKTPKRLPGQVGCSRAPTQPGPPPAFNLPVEVG